ncbi:lipoate--protein ligase family protein [Hugenholtzia roseola]|uniref:lipoate--protein ligase family protein n=1 Tax=Hugenholtzia roseola TaxID=1002 RepID=UPI0004295014|nr:lipoate--protein ligase [Hugenholtzia roseola]
MKLLLSPSFDAAFNLATEEYAVSELLKNASEAGFLFLYRNAPCVVLGKNQNLLEEVDYHFLKNRQIPLRRRISGGGTVYHDLGNLNFSFILPKKITLEKGLTRLMQPLVAHLQHLGVPATLNHRNDIYIGEKKVTGTAQHLTQEGGISHGTLLFNSDLETLQRAILPPSAQPQNHSKTQIDSKSLKSVRAKGVANIRDFLNQDFDIHVFEREVAKAILGENYEQIALSPIDLKHIEALAETKYRTWEWNFAKATRCKIEKTAILAGQQWELRLQIGQQARIEALEMPQHSALNPFLQTYIGEIYSDQNMQLLAQSLIKNYPAFFQTWKAEDFTNFTLFLY